MFLRVRQSCTYLLATHYSGFLEAHSGHYRIKQYVSKDLLRQIIYPTMREQLTKEIERKEINFAISFTKIGGNEWKRMKQKLGP